MSNTFRTALSAVMLSLGVSASAQTIAVTGSHIQDSTGSLVANATISFAPVDNNGHAISFRSAGAGGGQVVFQPVTATVTAGVFHVTLPDTSQTVPLNVCFKATAVDNVSGESLLGSGYNCVQPSSTSAQDTWCTNTTGVTTCNFDLFEPNLPGLSVVMVGHTGAAGVAGPAGAGTLTFGTSYLAFGDSITYGFTLSDINDRYPQLIATQLGITLNDHAVSGDQACDEFPHGVTSNLVSHLTGNPIMSNMIGTNDADVKGVGAYETIFKACHQAVLAWLVTPREDMVLPGDAGMTGSGGWPGTLNGITTGVYGTSPASAGSLTTILQTYGNPIYGWYVLNDGDDGHGGFTVTVDGVSTGVTYSTKPTPSISTQAGTVASVALIRIPIAAGTHTIVATSAGVDVGILGWGTLPANKYFDHPVLLSGDLPNQCAAGQTCGSTVGSLASVATQLQYNQDIIDDENLLIGDGADIRHVQDRKYFLGTSDEMNDQLHPNAAGQALLAQSFANTFQATPLIAEATSVAFPGVAAGTNTNPLVIGSGGSLGASGTGTINATALLGNTWQIPGFIGLTTPNGAFFTGVTVDYIRGRANALGINDPQGNAVTGMYITPDSSSANYILATTNAFGAFAWGVDITGATHQPNTAYIPNARIGSGAAGISGDADGTSLDTSPIITPFVRTSVYTVAALPSASTSGNGAFVQVSDATSYTPGTCTGGGTDRMIAVSDGTTWTCH